MRSRVALPEVMLGSQGPMHCLQQPPHHALFFVPCALARFSVVALFLPSIRVLSFFLHHRSWFRVPVWLWLCLSVFSLEIIQWDVTKPG